MKLTFSLQTLIPAIASLLAVGFISIDYALTSKRVLTQETANYLDNLRFTTTQFQGNLNRALRRNDRAAAKQLLLDLNYLPMMREAYVIDDQHRITFATDLSKSTMPFSVLSIANDIDIKSTTNFKQDQLIHLDEKQLAFFIYPIDAPRTEAGTSLRPAKWALVIGIDYSTQLNDLQTEIRMAAIQSGGMFFGVILLLSFLLHFLVSRRLRFMLKAIDNYSKGNIYSRSELRGNDELAQISRSVDLLMDSVDIKQQELEESHLNLEKVNIELNFQKLALDEHSIVSITDQLGVITYANDLFCSISGYSRDELIGKTHRMLNSKEHDKAFFDDLWKTISSGNIWQGQLKNKTKDGSFYWVASTIVPSIDPETNNYRYIAIRTDITAEKTLSESLLDIQKRNKQMYGIIAHELRTPVSAIEMMTHHESEEWINDKHQVALAAKDLLHSIDDMKMLVNPELKREIHLESTTVAQLNTAINSMVASAIALNHIEFKQITKLPDQLESLSFTTDAYRIKACVTNLIRNACLHSEGSMIWCSTDSQLDQDGNTLLRWTISDDGKGISAVQQRKMFKAFERGDTQSKGTGLGLHIAKSWIQEIGGNLQYRRLSPGSEFTLTVPLKPVRESEPSGDLSLPFEDIEQYAKQLKVLFVEDDKLLQMVTPKLLGPLFAAFDLANDGLEGLEMAKGDYDLILTDYFMPNMTGVEMTQKLRQEGDLRPIISATAATIGKESQELIDAGVDLVLPKPLSKESILKALHSLSQQGKLSNAHQNDVA